MSDGLIPPLNAPPAGQVVTGVQPGVSNSIVFANQVIVFGPSGSVSGVFVYAPGTTPALGNPPVIALTSSPNDPFGNVVTGGDEIVSTTPYLLVQDSGGRYIQLATAAAFGAFLALGSGDASENQPGILTAQMIGAGTARQLASTLKSPRFAAALDATLFLESASADAGATSGATIIGSLAQGGSFQLGLDGTGSPEFILGTNTPLKATHPGGANAETWQDMRPLQNAFVGTIAGDYPPQYRLNGLGRVEIWGAIQLPAAYNAVTFATLAAGYRPAAHTQRYPIAYQAGTAPPASARAQCDTGGNLQLQGLPAGAAGTNVWIGGGFPLDSTGLITV